MKKIRILAITILVVMLIFTLGTFEAFAGSNNGIGTKVEVISSFDKTQVKPADNITISISLVNLQGVNIAIKGFAFAITYDNTKYNYVSYEKFTDSKIDESAKFTINPIAGKVTMTYIETTGSENKGLLAGNIVKITFKAKEGATLGKTTFTISNSLNNLGGYPIDFDTPTKNKITAVFLPTSQDIEIATTSNNSANSIPSASELSSAVTPNSSNNSTAITNGSNLSSKISSTATSTATSTTTKPKTNKWLIAFIIILITLAIIGGILVVFRKEIPLSIEKIKKFFSGLIKK